LLCSTATQYVCIAIACNTAAQTSSEHADEPQHREFITAAADQVLSGMRVTGRTAYVAAFPGARAAAPLDTQALAVSLLSSLARPDDASVLQKLTAHVAGDSAAQDVFAARLLPPISPSDWVRDVQLDTCWLQCECVETFGTLR
jgi:hypothetical protein